MDANRTRQAACIVFVTSIFGAITPALAAGPNQGKVVAPSLVTPPATSGYACVNRGLSVVKGDHVVSATQGETPVGSAVVKFDSNITKCVYVATIGLCGAQFVEQPGFITTVRRFNDPDAVYVETRDPLGNLANRAFHLVVDCE